MQLSDMHIGGADCIHQEFTTNKSFLFLWILFKVLMRNNYNHFVIICNFLYFSSLHTCPNCIFFDFILQLTCLMDPDSLHFVTFLWAW